MFRASSEIKQPAGGYGAYGQKPASYWVPDKLTLDSLRKAIVASPGILQEEAWTSKCDSTMINFSSFIKKQLSLTDDTLQEIVNNSQMFRTMYQERCGTGLYGGPSKMLWDPEKLNDIKAVEQWIIRHPYVVTEMDVAGETLVDFVLRNAHMRLGSLLLKYQGFNVFAGNVDKAIFFGALSADFEKFSTIFVKSKNIHCKYPYNTTLLHAASYGGNSDIVSLLIAKGLKVDTRIKHQCIHQQKYDEEAAKAYDKPVPKLMPGFTELYIAARAGHLGVVKVLLDSGSEINKKVHICVAVEVSNGYGRKEYKYEEYENTALDIAAELNKEDIVEELLTRGISEVEQTLESFHDNAQITKLLLAHTDDMDTLRRFVTVQYGKTHDINPDIAILIQNRIEQLAFLLAAQKGNILVLQASLYLGVDLNSKLKDYSTALHLAVTNGSIDVIGVLIERSINVDSKNKAGLTAIEIGAISKNTTIVKLLLPHVTDESVLQKILQDDGISSNIHDVIKSYIDSISFAHVAELIPVPDDVLSATPAIYENIHLESTDVELGGV